jgi:hypothetical protein
VETSRKSAFDITKNGSDKGKVRLPRVVHEETHLLDHITRPGRVRVRYCCALARLRYLDRSTTGAPSVAKSLDLESTSVVVG